MVACDCIPKPHDTRMLRNWPGRLGVAVGELKPGPGQVRPTSILGVGTIYLFLVCPARW